MDDPRITARSILLELLHPMLWAIEDEGGRIRRPSNSRHITPMNWFYKQNPTAFYEAISHLEALIDDLEKEAQQGAESDTPNA